MNLFAVKTAARGLTFRRWATTLEISNAVERKPNHLSGGGPTGCHGRSAENPITVPKTDVAGTGQSQQTVASPRVIRYSLLRDFMDSTKRSEEHTSELQSRLHLVCRLLLEKKKITHERSLCYPAWEHSRWPSFPPTHHKSTGASTSSTIRDCSLESCAVLRHALNVTRFILS